LRHAVRVDITLGDFNDARVKALLEYHLRGMHENSPPGHVFALDWSGLQKPEISFYTGWVGQSLVAIGALKALGDNTGELKSMRVAQGQSGRGFGQAMLRHLMAEARARGFSRLSLETGSGPAFAPALALYRKHGFVPGAAFADYVQSPFCQFYHLAL
jgi:putative acetyltransferase